MAYEYKVYLEYMCKEKIKSDMANIKQKVLMVHNYYQIPGGEDTVMVNEKKLLEDYGHTVILYTRNNLELKEMSKIQKLMLPITTVFNFRTYQEVKRIIEEQQIDVVHVHNTLNLVSPSLYYAACSMGIPVVQTIHNFRLLCPGATFYRDGHICEDCVDHGLSNAVKWCCYRESKLQTLACVISTKIHRLTGIYGRVNYICLTEFNKEKLLELKQIKSKNVFVKPNFVESDEKLVPYGKRENQFVFAGRLDKLKGIDLLLKTWKQIEKLGDAPKLVICGTGPMEEWCKNFIIDNGLKSIEMLGFVPNIEARKIIAISKALILPTQWYEGFPMTVVEAYSAGTPVIGSDIGNVGSLVHDGVTGYKFKHNSVEHLLQVISHNSLDICDKTKDFFKNNYMKVQNYEQLISIYSKVYK